VGVGCMERHPGEHNRQIFQEVLHKQCFGRIQNDILLEDDGEDKMIVTDNDSVMSDDGESDE
jgi:hypothetical protein